MGTTSLVNAEQLLQMPENRWHELVAGELTPMTPPSSLHAAVVSLLDGILGHHVRKHKLGVVLAGDPGFLLARDPDTVLAPDIAFIRADRIAVQPLGEGYWPGAPDLAVEVLSPANAPKEAHDKALAWLHAGALLVWVVDPAPRTVTVYRSATDIQPLTQGAELDAPSLLPGFHCPITDLFINR
jgi:Uma2 family endonuclease